MIDRKDREQRRRWQPRPLAQWRREQHAMQDFSAARALIAAYTHPAEPLSISIFEAMVEASERGELEGAKIIGISRYSRTGSELATILRWNRGDRKPKNRRAQDIADVELHSAITAGDSEPEM